MPQLGPSLFTFAPVHLFYAIIISVDGDQIGGNFRESMPRNPAPYGMARLIFSWNKTTDNFFSPKGIFSAKIVMFLLSIACSPCFLCPFRFQKLLLDHLHSLFKRSIFPIVIFYRSPRKHLSKLETHDFITMLLKEKFSPFLESIDKRLK